MQKSGFGAWIRRHYMPLTITIISLMLFCAGMLNAHMHKSYNSDDVAQQVVLKDVELNEEPPTDDRKIYFGSDSFIIKFPFYWLANQFDYGTRANVFMTSFVLALAGLIFFLGAAWWLHKFFSGKQDRPDWRLAALLWPWCLGLFFFTLFVNPNLRNIELGLGFALIAALFYLFAHTHKPQTKQNHKLRLIIGGVVMAVLLGLFYYSDPFIEYVLFLPLLLLAGYKVATDWKRYRAFTPVLAVLIGSFAASVVIRNVLNHLGFISHNAPTEFAELAKIPDHIMLSLQGLFTMFNADFFGRPAFSPHALLKLAFLLPIVALILAYRDAGVRASLKTNFLHQFLIFQIVFTIALFVFSKNPVDLSTTRYFVILPLSASLLALVVAYAYSKRKIAIAVCVCIAFILTGLGAASNVYMAYKEYKTNDFEVTSSPVPLQVQSTAGLGNARNKINKQIAKVAIENNLHKGYAAFWSGPINTYFSQNKAKFQPVFCGPNNKIAPYYWLLDTQTLKAPAEESFFLYNAANDFSTSDGWCGSVPKITEQFGRPVKVLPVTDTIRFYVYDYDILKNMQLSY